MKIKAVIALLIVLLVIVFALQNIEITDVRILFWKLSTSRVLVILGSFTIGVLVGVLASVKRKRFFTK